MARPCWAAQALFWAALPDPTPLLPSPAAVLCCLTPVLLLLQNILGLAVAALFIAYNYFTAEAPGGQE